MFKIGQKVVCIDASPGRITGATYLVKDEIYTILGIDAREPLTLYVLPQDFRDGADGWLATRFRPLVSIDDLNIEQYLQPVETLETV